MDRSSETLKVLKMLRNGDLQDPEKASIIPCELWKRFYKADAERVLVLATSELAEGATDEDRLNVLQACMAQNSTDCFMRGLSFGYRAFGHKEAATNAFDVCIRLAEVHNVLLLGSILQNFGSDVLAHYLTIVDENEEGTDND